MVYTGRIGRTFPLVGIEPCYFRVVYTETPVARGINSGIQPCYFLGGVYHTNSRYDGLFWYTTLLFLGGVYPFVYVLLINLWYTSLLFLGGCIPSTGIQFPKALVATSRVTTSQQSIPASTTTKHLHRR